MYPSHKSILRYITLFVVLAAVGIWLFKESEQAAAPVAFSEKGEPGPDMRPSEWEWLRRTSPYGNADAEAFQKEFQRARQMRATAKPMAVQAVEFAGPSNIGGRIVDIEFNPQDPTIVYAAAATGGVFKSTDTGNTWFPIFDDVAILTIGDICVDPANPDIIYVGTGEANGGHNNMPGGGLYKSTDAGATWQLMGLENTVSIGRVRVNPLNTQEVFVAAQGSYFAPNPDRGLYHSTDGGATWDNIFFISDSTGATDLIIDPANPQRMIVAMWERVRYPEFGTHLYGETSGLYRTTDGGANWTELSGGLPNPDATNVGRIGLDIYAANPDIAYAIYTNGSNISGLFKTTNFGDSWTNVDPDDELSNGTGGFSWYFGQVRVHPTNPDIVYVLDVAFMRSVNGGANWPIIYGYGGPNILHVDHHALAFHPTNPDYILNGNDGGINISTDGGVNFTKVADLPVNQFYEIGLDRNNPERLYGGTQDNGTLRTLTGATDDWTRIFGGDGFYVIVDHSNPNIIYAESQNGNLGKSTNGGASFFGATSGISGRTNWSTPVVMDPVNSSILYYGSDRVWKTTNGASSWTAVSPVLHNATPGSRLGTVTTIGVSPALTSVVWAGTDDGKVWVTADGGSNWTNTSTGLPNRWVTRVIAHPVDEATAYATFNGLRWKEAEAKVMRTTNLGASWEDITANLPEAPVNAFAVFTDDNFRTYLFAGSDLGAYYSVDDGLSWEYISSDFPMVTVYDMKVHETADYLAIGTHARSMYKMDLAQILVGIDDPATDTAPQDFALLQNYPNPFNPTTTIPVKLATSADIRLTIFDNLGRTVRNLVDGNVSAGSHDFEWNGRNNRGEAVASGTYFYRLDINGQQSRSQMNKMMLSR
ncbi:MAG: T9SS type A sorting domain-containing protein [Calditrichae bacterium]|nr:T9SS type A sorting domain-containing protein [Calditrichia bacterium]